MKKREARFQIASFSGECNSPIPLIRCFDVVTCFTPLGPINSSLSPSGGGLALRLKAAIFCQTFKVSKTTKVFKNRLNSFMISI